MQAALALEGIAAGRHRVRRLMGMMEQQSIYQKPGIGPMGATALIAAVGDGKQFSKARDLASWLGLVPRQH